MNSHGRKTKGNGIFDYREGPADRLAEKAMTWFERGILIGLLGWAAYGVLAWLCGG